MWVSLCLRACLWCDRCLHFISRREVFPYQMETYAETFQTGVSGGYGGYMQTPCKLNLQTIPFVNVPCLVTALLRAEARAESSTPSEDRIPSIQYPWGPLALCFSSPPSSCLLQVCQPYLRVRESCRSACFLV